MASTDNTETQSTEVAKVKESYTGQCRIITDLGEFSYVVTLQPKQQDIIYKFQLKKTYPSTKPNIIVRSGTMSSEDLAELQGQLVETARSLVGSPMILALLDRADQWIQENKIVLDGSVKAKSATTEKEINRRSKNHQKRRERKAKIEEEETKDEKKPSMKTAEDVVKRILWDQNLPTDEFIVGYIDRFLGIQEKYFTAFSWEDIASVDYNVLAVPKHRIQYFKYKDVKVWDKTTRFDNVFGSTGSGTTIYDVIQKYNEDKETADREAETNTENTGNDYDDDYDDDDDSDSDDGITVTTGNEGGNAGLGNMEEENGFVDDFDDDVNEGYDKYWRDRMRPNHFLALRITNDDIKKVVEGIQDSILDHEPMYAECCIPLNALHITLCTVGLDTPEQVAHACDVLKKIQPELSEMVPSGTTVIFKGMENFFNRVLYAKCVCPTEFTNMVDHLKLCLKQEGIDIRDNHDFVPHMTIMKVTRPVARATGKKYIAPWLYSNSQNIDFGTQVLDNIHLCSMGIDRQADGFYIAPAKIEL